MSLLAAVIASAILLGWITGTWGFAAAGAVALGLALGWYAGYGYALARLLKLWEEADDAEYPE